MLLPKALHTEILPLCSQLLHFTYLYPSLAAFADLSQSTLQAFSEVTPTPAEVDARLALYMKRTEEEEDEEEEVERVPDLEKDDMMARRTGVFHKQSSTPAAHTRFLPLPGSKHHTPDASDHFPWNKKEVQSDGSRNVNVRWARVCDYLFLIVCRGD